MSSEPLKYHVATASTTWQLENEVHEKLKEGYFLLGGVSVAKGSASLLYAQAMAKGWQTLQPPQ